MYLFFLFLIFTLNCCNKFNPEPENKAKFVSSDGVVLVGKFVPPKTNDKLTFIMLHGLASSKIEWFNFASKLSEKGYGYFIYDLRGHGESNKKTNDQEVNMKYFFQTGHNSDWEKMIDDLNYAVKYLRHKGIKKDKIGIIGASLGANISLIYSAKHKFIPVVILLSPGWSYAGLTVDKAIKEYGERPILIAVSVGDKYAYDSSVVMFDISRKNKSKVEFFVNNGISHGVQMFDGKFEYKIIDWIEHL